MAGVKRSTAKVDATKSTAKTRATQRKVAVARSTARRDTSKRGLPTAAGTRLTRNDEWQLAADAAAGFDLPELTPRRVGRPSISGRPGKSRRLDPACR